ncbi:unknown protein (Partial), partial [Seminavis robusta]|eukprot:Sro2575_g331720.1 n/a (287) ;mRNA; r:2-862
MLPVMKFDGTPIYPKPILEGTGPNKICHVPGSPTQVSMKKVNKEEFHDLFKKLIGRLTAEYVRYGANMKDDFNQSRLLALGCNPFTSTYLLNELVFLGTMVADPTVGDPKYKPLTSDLKKLVKDILMKEVREICSELLKDPEMVARATFVEYHDDDPTVSDFEKLRRKKQRNEEQVPVQAALGDRVEREVEAWFSQDFHLTTALKLQKSRPVPQDVLDRLGTNKICWLENVEKIVQHFDIMDWWEREGKITYPLIYAVACCILALPDSNGFQERTFSAATWMDGILN